jgi:hypothetical protein
MDGARRNGKTHNVSRQIRCGFVDVGGSSIIVCDHSGFTRERCRKLKVEMVQASPHGGRHWSCSLLIGSSIKTPHSASC